MSNKFTHSLSRLLHESNPSLDLELGMTTTERRLFWQNLGTEMDTVAVVALSEHLREFESIPSKNTALSNSPKTWQQARLGFKRIQSEMDERLGLFLNKWQQRWSLEYLCSIASSASLYKSSSQGCWIDKAASARDWENLFKAFQHEMVKDLEKELIFAEARIRSLQDLITKDWYARGIVDPEDRLLPTLESALRPAELHFLRQSREKLYSLCEKGFLLRAKEQQGRIFPTPELFFQSIALYSNTANRPILSESCDFVRQLCAEWLDWYAGKWALFLRGCYLHKPMELGQNPASKLAQ